MNEARVQKEIAKTLRENLIDYDGSQQDEQYLHIAPSEQDEQYLRY